MGRKDTLAAKSIRKMYEQLNLNQSDIFSKTKLLLLSLIHILILLAAFQMVMSIGAYYICAASVTHTQDYNFILEPLRCV